MVFGAEQFVNEQAALLGVRSDGTGLPHQLDAPLPAPSALAVFELATSGEQVAFVSDDLYWTMASGGFDPVRLNAPLVPGGSIRWGNPGQEPPFTPDGRHVVYEADQDVAGVVELYVSRITRVPRRADGL